MRDLLERVATTPDETVLIVFTAANCGPCKLQKQELLEFRQRLLTSIHNDGDDSNSSESSKEAAASVSPPPLPRLKMLSIDTSKWPHVGLSWFQVSKLPCLVVLRDQQVVARLEGLTRADTLLDILRPHLFLSQQ
jgi:thiol-disulfide isomerase/thioredoxin